MVGILLAVVMLTAMAVSVFRLRSARAEEQALERYVSTLQQENARLEQTYRQGYDLDEIEKIALAMGLVPVDQAAKLPIEVTPIQPAPEPGVWASVWAFLRGLFA